MQEVPHPSVAQSNTVKQSDCCSRGNSGCKYIYFLVQISVQLHSQRKKAGTAETAPAYLLDHALLDHALHGFAGIFVALGCLDKIAGNLITIAFKQKLIGFSDLLQVIFRSSVRLCRQYSLGGH
jgi:hypothetical protein